MTTTQKFQIKPDYYFSKDEAKASSKNRIQTNIRYKNFQQTQFTAGDEEQFQQYRFEKNGSVCIPNISLEDNLFEKESLFTSWDGYKNLEATSVLNTFRYLFNKFKKGIFVKILNNELKVFLPFSNVNFVNEWSHNIKIDPKYGNLQNFFKHISDLQGYPFRPKNINNVVNTWYGNNCLVRSEYPIGEGDNNVSILKNMFEELCKNRVVPDVELFFNRRDFPLLTRNGTEAYYNLWNSYEKPLVSHKYDKYVPILSMSNTDHFADLLIPTHEDWSRVQSKENIFFPSSQTYEDFNINWESKKPIAVFRGGTTGCGVKIETNQRLKIAYLSSKNLLDKDGLQFLDAGISNWNVRPRKLIDSPYLQTIDVEDFPFDLVKRMTPKEQSEYKYIIHIDGHVSAFRLSYEFSMNSVILLVNSNWKIWFSNMIKPYVHYVPVKSDLSDIYDQIKWCKENDEKCKQIATNSKVFYDTYLCKKGILDYMQKIMIDIKNETGFYLYNYISPLDNQIQNEYSYISKESSKFPESKKGIDSISTIPFSGRTYSLLQGLHWIINMINTTSNLENHVKFVNNIFQNKLGIVRQFDIVNFSLAIKTTSDSQKIKEHIHETFVGLCGINQIVKQIPNFTYIFGLYKDENKYNVITELIHGETLDKYIDGNYFSFQGYLSIILQICLALEVAQSTCCLVHNDLTPWNIVLQYSNTPIDVDYIIGNKIYKFKSTIIPVIIDYGKSHIVHDNKKYGFINMYRFSTIQDVLTVFTTSIFQIINKNYISKNDIDNVINLANFISGTTYRRNKFSNSYDVNLFFKNAKKYSKLISDDKYELENKTPLDLFNYIINNFKYQFNFKISTIEYNSLMNKGNSRQVFEYILSKTNESKIDSYLNVCYRLKACSLPQPKNLLFTYYVSQILEDNLNSVKNNMLYFLERENINSAKYETLFDKTLQFIFELYGKKINNMTKKDININNNFNFSLLKDFNYSETTFLLPSIVEELLSENENKNMNETNDVFEYKNVVNSILFFDGHFKIKNKDRQYYLINFNKLLDTDVKKMKNNFANYNTLSETASEIYKFNLKEIKIPDDINQNCTDIKKYVKIYKDITS